MIDHVLPRMACSCAIFAIALAHCGCQSMSGPLGWGSTSSKPTNPNDRKTSRYVFQKKDKPKPVDPDELKGQFARGAENRQSTFETSMRLGNAALQDKQGNRLDEARREYEKALALWDGILDSELEAREWPRARIQVAEIKKLLAVKRAATPRGQ